MKTKMKKARKIFSLVLLVLLLVFAFSFSVNAEQIRNEPFFYSDNANYLNENLRAIEHISDVTNRYSLVVNLQMFWTVIAEQSYDFYYRNTPSGTWQWHVNFVTGAYPSIQVTDVTNMEFFTFTPSSNPRGIVIFTFDSSNLSLNWLNNSTNHTAIQLYSNGQYTSILQYLPGEKQQSYNEGYAAGLQAGRDENEAGSAGAQLIFAVVEAPFNVLRQMLSFDILGVNVFGLVMSVFTLCLIAAVIRFII